MNNYFSLTLHFLCPKLNYIFSFAPIKCIVCLGGCRIRKGWDDSLPLGGKSFQWCVALMDFSLVSSHYLHNSVACFPNKLDYYAPTPSFLGTQIYSLRTQSFLSFLSKFVFLNQPSRFSVPVDKAEWMLAAVAEKETKEAAIKLKMKGSLSCDWPPSRHLCFSFQRCMRKRNRKGKTDLTSVISQPLSSKRRYSLLPSKLCLQRMKPILV